MKNLIVLFLVVTLTLSFVACGYKDSQASGQEPSAASTTNAELEAIQKDFEALQSKKVSILTGAQEVPGKTFCSAYKEMLAYRALKDRYDKISNGVYHGIGNDLANVIESRIGTVAQLGYQTMLDQKPLYCNEVRETVLIEEVGGMIDHVNRNFLVDEKVIRAAYLRAERVEVKQWLDAYQERPESGDVTGGLFQEVNNATVNWGFTLEELGVPADVAEKLGLHNG